jgi:hypothetical protein
MLRFVPLLLGVATAARSHTRSAPALEDVILVPSIGCGASFVQQDEPRSREGLGGDPAASLPAGRQLSGAPQTNQVSNVSRSDCASWPALFGGMLQAYTALSIEPRPA